MASSRLKIVLVGGGSNAWSHTIVRDILLTPSLGSRCDIVLLDIRKDRAELVATMCRRMADELGVGATFVATDRQRQALDGAGYVIITISTGGLDAMAHDIAIPEQFGIYHTVGDTSGPGGWSRTIRNFGVFAQLGRDISRYAPNALVLNYTNPMTCLTDILSRTCRNHVVGLCHGLFENLEFITRYYQAESEAQIAAQYAGINHFFFITECRVGDTDVIADLLRKTRRGSLTRLLKEVYKDPAGFQSDRELASELLRLTGALPYIGDRHTCEFLPGYITSKSNMRKYRLRRTSIAERRRGFAARQKQLERWVKKGMPDDMKKRSRETAADITDAHANGRVFIDVGNVPNIGQVSNLPRGLVVETAVRVDRNGFSPIAFGDLPPAVLGLVEPYGHVFPMTVNACFQGDLGLALQALRLDPVCAHLTFEQISDMGRRLLAAHKTFVKCF